ncbi:MAG TPA: GYD domain-containing protein [Devosia sp.]|nr:GYD domain-containing protein [Devosia sp.]
MSKYILLLNWTEQGIKAIKSSGERYEAAQKVAARSGCKLETVYMTFGPYDQVAILDAPSDEAAATFNLRIAALGNIRCQTLKAFTEAEYKKITAAV